MSGPQQTITTSLGTYEYKFPMYIHGTPDIKYDEIVNNVNIYGYEWNLYSDIELTNKIGYSYASGLDFSFKNQIVDSCRFIVDLQTILNLGTFTIISTFVNVEKNNTDPAPVQLLNNSIIVNGTGNYAYAMGDLIISNCFGDSLVEILYYQKVA